MLCFLRAEYNGKSEFLYLPCEEEAIDKAFARLGAPTPDDVELSWEDICIENEKWTERFKEIAAEEGVYELNCLAAAVNSADMDMEKLWAVAEYAEAENAEQLARLAKNIDCFTFVEGANYFQEIGEYVTQNNEDFTVNPAVAKFFDYKAFGKYIGDAYYGEFVDGGFIYNDTDTSLLDILYQDEPSKDIFICTVLIVEVSHYFLSAVRTFFMRLYCNLIFFDFSRTVLEFAAILCYTIFN